MKFIHTADWHIWLKHKYSDSSSRFDKLISNAMEIAECAIENKVDLFIIAGDVFQTYNPHSIELRKFAEVIHHICEKNICVRIITGNHDTDGVNHSLEPLQKILEASGEMKNGLVKIFSRKIVAETMGGVRFIYVPYREDVDKALRVAKESRIFDIDMNGNVLVAHLAVDGAIVGASNRPLKTKIGEDLLSGYSYVGLGDYHKHQQVGSDMFKKTNSVYYSGSIIRLNWDERKEGKYFNYVEIENGRSEVSVVPLSDWNMIDVTIRYEDIVQYEGLILDEINDTPIQDSLIKLYITGEIGSGRMINVMKKVLYDSGAQAVYDKVITTDELKVESSKDNIEMNLNPEERIKQFGEKNNLSKDDIDYGLETYNEEI